MKAEDIRRGGTPPKKAESEEPKKVGGAVGLPIGGVLWKKYMQPQAPVQREKVPWPGDWAVARAGAFVSGMSGDRSGVDAIDRWCETATPQELDHVFGPIGPDGKRQFKKGRCYTLGHLHGLVGGMILWPKIFQWLGIFRE